MQVFKKEKEIIPKWILFVLIVVIGSIGIITVGCDSTTPSKDPVLPAGLHIITDGQIDGETENEVDEEEFWAPEDYNPGSDTPNYHSPNNPYTLDWMINDHIRRIESSALLAGAGDLLENMAAFQHETFNFTLKTDNWYLGHGDPQNRTSQVQVAYKIQSAHQHPTSPGGDSFDWYVVQQEITISNGPLWVNTLRKYSNFWATTHMKDFWLRDVTMNNRIYRRPTLASPDYREVPIDRLDLHAYSPQTVNGVTSYTSGVSGNIGGNVGYNSATGFGVNSSGGVSFSNSSTSQISDFALWAYALDSSTTKNAKWFWQAQSKPTYNIAVNINPPAPLSISTFTVTTSWVWVVRNPDIFSPYRLRFDLSGKHGHSYFDWLHIAVFPMSMEHSYYSWNFAHQFDLNPPYRGTASQ